MRIRKIRILSNCSGVQQAAGASAQKTDRSGAYPIFTRSLSSSHPKNQLPPTIVVGPSLTPAGLFSHPHSHFAGMESVSRDDSGGPGCACMMLSASATRVLLEAALGVDNGFGAGRYLKELGRIGLLTK